MYILGVQIVHSTSSYRQLVTGLTVDGLDHVVGDLDHVVGDLDHVDDLKVDRDISEVLIGDLQ